MIGSLCIYIGPDWIPMSSNLGQIGAGLAQIGSQVDSTWAPGDPTGPTWDPTGSRARFGNLASSQVRCLRIRSAFLEFVAGDAGDAGDGEVVSRRAARSPPPHAPGARMTVVTLTPSNYRLATSTQGPRRCPIPDVLENTIWGLTPVSCSS